MTDVEVRLLGPLELATPEGRNACTVVGSVRSWPPWHFQPVEPWR